MAKQPQKRGRTRPGGNHSASKPARQKEPNPQPDLGLWVDPNLAARLRGDQGRGLEPTPSDLESERLLHYADIALGLKKPSKFVSKKPRKD